MLSKCKGLHRFAAKDSFNDVYDCVQTTPKLESCREYVSFSIIQIDQLASRLLTLPLLIDESMDGRRGNVNVLLFKQQAKEDKANCERRRRGCQRIATNETVGEPFQFHSALSHQSAFIY
jgi:hypothetical protein